MSVDLKDLRAKVTPETDAVLEGIARATGRDRSEIVREVLHRWAASEIDKASMVHRMLKAEGLPGIAQGTSGNLGE